MVFKRAPEYFSFSIQIEADTKLAQNWIQSFFQGNT